MGHQPEYCQPHSHEQIEPALSFGVERVKQIVFHQFACRIRPNPVRLISHAVTTNLTNNYLFQYPQSFYNSPLVEEAQDNNRDHRSQEQIYQRDNQCGKQSEMQRKVPHRRRVQNAFQNGKVAILLFSTVQQLSFLPSFYNTTVEQMP